MLVLGVSWSVLPPLPHNPLSLTKRSSINFLMGIKHPARKGNSLLSEQVHSGERGGGGGGAPHVGQLRASELCRGVRGAGKLSQRRAVSIGVAVGRAWGLGDQSESHSLRSVRTGQGIERFQ